MLYLKIRGGRKTRQPPSWNKGGLEPPEHGAPALPPLPFSLTLSPSLYLSYSHFHSLDSPFLSLSSSSTLSLHITNKALCFKMAYFQAWDFSGFNRNSDFLTYHWCESNVILHFLPNFLHELLSINVTDLTDSMFCIEDLISSIRTVVTKLKKVK